MRGTMDVGVFMLVEVRQPVDDSLRLLRGGGIVKPDQWPPLYHFVQNREITSHRIGVKRGMRSRKPGHRRRPCPLAKRRRTVEEIERRLAHSRNGQSTRASRGTGI